MKTRARVFDGGRFSYAAVEVSDESLATLYLNGLKFLSLFVSPRDLEELAVGFIVSEGLSGYAAVRGVRVDGDRVFVELDGKENAELLVELRSSGCSGVISGEPEPLSPDYSFRASVILSSLPLLEKESSEWQRTGGVHTAVLVDSAGACVCSFSDVGRHNALDKVVGRALLDGVSLEDKFLLFSGRLSAGIVRKSARVGLPLLVSRSAALSQAVELAEKLNLTLVGFAREKSLKIYSCTERVV